MADKKLTKRKRKNQTEEDVSLTKDEEVVAKYLRFNLESKKSTLLGDEAHYFFGSKAVDFLMDSKWASGCKSSVVFTHRESVVAFLNRLLGNRYFDHVHVIKTEKKVKKKDGDKKKDEIEKKDDIDKKKENDKKKVEKVKVEEKEKEEKKSTASPRAKRDKEGKEIKKVKKKVKINLEPHEDQIFFDNDDEAFVWIYDPVSWKTFFFGILLVLAIIAVCLFPLWPENVREYSWYLSVAGAIFVGGILVLAVLRYVIYGLLWICTVGKLHYWLLPNLTAECGFFESFVPTYEYTFVKSEEKEEDEDEEEQGKSEKKNQEKSGSEKEKSGSEKEKSGSEKEKSGSDAHHDKDNDDQLECDDPNVELLNVEIPTIEFIDKSKSEFVEYEVLKCDTDTEHASIEELVDHVDTVPHEIGVDNIKDSTINKTIDDSPEDISQKQDLIEGITDDLTFIDKLENESEESNGSTKEDGWVKVKKDDVDKDDLPKNENRVEC